MLDYITSSVHVWVFCKSVNDCIILFFTPPRLDVQCNVSKPETSSLSRSTTFKHNGIQSVKEEWVGCEFFCCTWDQRAERKGRLCCVIVLCYCVVPPQRHTVLAKVLKSNTRAYLNFLLGLRSYLWQMRMSSCSTESLRFKSGLIQSSLFYSALLTVQYRKYIQYQQ